MTELARAPRREPVRPMGVAVVVLVAAAAIGRADQSPRQLSLAEAQRLAFERSPTLRARRATLAEARGRLVTAGTYRFNPEVEGELARRDGGDVVTTDYEIALSQELELAGQRGKRTATARAELDAAENAFLRDGRLLAAQVERAFAGAVRARERLVIDETDLELARDFLSYTRRRFDAGAASQIELNLAAAAAGRAERSRLASEAQAWVARSLLAEAIGLAPSVPPEPEGDLRVPEAELRPLADLVAGAHERRADFAAFRAAGRAAEERLRLARAEAIPNLRLGGFYGREEGRDTLVGGRVSIALPLFNRNQGAVAEARAGIDRASYETAALSLSVEREVSTAWASHRSAREAARRLEEQVVGTLEENLGLLQRALQAGKVSATDMLLFRREFVEARREFVDAAFEAWVTRVGLDLAAGRLPDRALIEETK